MKVEIAKKWAEALRSGKYAQCTGKLRKRADLEGAPDRFCCLGVLCDVVKEAGGPAMDWNFPRYYDGSALGYYRYGDHADFPPQEVWVWAEMKTANPSLPAISAAPWGSEATLAGLNDHGASFAEIADAIEQHAADL